MVQYST